MTYETDKGFLKIKNLSLNHSIRNIFALCSHPMIFDFYIKRLQTAEGDELVLGPGQDILIPINFRAAIKGQFSVRFLFRYQVDSL